MVIFDMCILDVTCLSTTEEYFITEQVVRGSSRQPRTMQRYTKHGWSVPERDRVGRQNNESAKLKLLLKSKCMEEYPEDNTINQFGAKQSVCRELGNIGEMLKTTVQKVMIPKGEKYSRMLIYRNSYDEDDLLQFINKRVNELGIRDNTYSLITVTDDEIAPYLTPASINTVDNVGQSGVHLSVQFFESDVILKLMAAGGNPYLEDKLGLRPSHYAAIAGNLATLQVLPPDTWYSRDIKSHRTPMHYAAIVGSIDVIKFLHSSGQDIDTQDLFGNSPLVLTAMYGHPSVAEELIEMGASSDVENICGIEAIISVAKFYHTLGCKMLDRYKTVDEYSNTAEVNIQPLLDREINTLEKYTFYQILINTSPQNEITSHEAVKQLTDKKWHLYAQSRFYAVLFGLLLFAFFWTAIYCWPHVHGTDATLQIVGFSVMLLGGCSIILHLCLNIYILIKKHFLNKYLMFLLDRWYAFEKNSKHHLLEHLMRHLKQERNKSRKQLNFASTVVIFLIKCVVDCLWITFLGLRVDAFVRGDIHTQKESARLHKRGGLDEEDDTGPSPSTYLVIGDLVISILLLLIWVQLFDACGISSRVGRFVVFTKEVIKDVAQVFAVYVVLFIPMSAILWKTVYSHASKNAHVEWSDIPFFVIRMAVVDYDYELGKDSAINAGIGKWWDIISLFWLLLSAMIILNLFIALMTDRYTRLGERAIGICDRKRAEFVSICELIMSPTKVNAFSKQILRENPTVRTSLDCDDGDNILKEIKILSDKVEDLSKRLDKVTGERRHRRHSNMSNISELTTPRTIYTATRFSSRNLDPLGEHGKATGNVSKHFRGNKTGDSGG